MQLTRLGPYEIEKPLGKGGMGSVFVARDSTTGEQVAVKALTPQLAMAEGFRERFEAEIESLKTLRHEGIVRLFGYGEQDSVLFYSMELVDGISLEDELKAGRRFNWREVSSIAIQLSLALKHAHDHGIVHRDIKPANILLYHDDRVKLADFGIARLFGTTQLTTAGGVLGTADYMSPEQADGRPVTARCDQYSLGGVMYALLAGRPPFRAKNLPQMLQLQRFAKPEPVRRYASDTPEQLERVIMQLLAKNPAERFPNTQVLARHLQALVMALSRPAHDDFALAEEHPARDRRDPAVDHAIADNATQTEAADRLNSPDSGAAIPSAAAKPRGAASQDAATLAAEEVMSNRAADKAAPVNAPSTDRAIPRLTERAAHFTTLEEEEARRRLEHQRSWAAVAAQLASLAAVLAAMGALAVYLSRPPTADDLYQTITSRVESDDDSSLADVDREIAEFLARYPTDPRTQELQRYQQRIALDRWERRLMREARGSGTASKPLLPAELLYLQAATLAQSDPIAATARLESLVQLYEAQPPTDGGKHPTNQILEPTEGDETSRTMTVVALAKRRLKDLHDETTKRTAQQLASLRERLNTAERLAANDPSQAASMYQALIELYRHEAWADEVVEEARRRLAEIRKEE